MIPIRYLVGDATSPAGPDARIIAHVCNDVGGWGRGFVMALSARWQEPEIAYRRWHGERASNDFALGAVQLVEVEPTLWVANMIGQSGIHVVDGLPPVRYEAIDTCLGRVAMLATARGASVHMPRIGCGLAGGRWDHIEPFIERRLAAAGIAAFVYDLG